MNRFQTAGVLWLVAAVSSAVATIAFREDSVWYLITLAASGVTAALGILVLWRPNKTSIFLSTIGGVGWIVLYGILVAIQSDDLQAWTANALFVVLGAAAAFLAYRAAQP